VKNAIALQTLYKHHNNSETKETTPKHCSKALAVD